MVTPVEPSAAKLFVPLVVRSITTRDVAPDGLVDATSSSVVGSVCVAWENAANEAATAGVRVVPLRIANVMGMGGGFLGKLLPIYRRGACFTLGDADGSFAWVSLLDAVRPIVDFEIGRVLAADPVSSMTSSGNSSIKRLGMQDCQLPYTCRLEAWLTIARLRARVSPT